SEAIERILGVPILTSSRVTLVRLKEKSERREATAAQGDQKTREFGNQLGDLHAQRQVLSDDLQRFERELEDMRSRKASLEEAMKRKERVAALLDKKDMLERMTKEITARRDAKQINLQQSMGDAWYTLLAEPIARAIKNLRASELDLQTELLRSDVLRSLQVDATSECPTCLQTISPKARQRIESATRGIDDQQRVERQRELATARRKLAALEQQSASATLNVIRLRWDAVEEASVDLASKRDELDELTKQL